MLINNIKEVVTNNDKILEKHWVMKVKKKKKNWKTIKKIRDNIRNVVRNRKIANNKGHKAHQGC